MPLRPFKSIRQATRLQLWLLLFAFSLLGAMAAWTIDETRVNGPLYREIETSRQLVIDILPPPLYIVEPYLSSVRLAFSGKAEQQAILRKLGHEIAVYREKKAEWLQQPLPQPLLGELSEQAIPSADQFILLAEQKLIPAVLADDRAAIDDLLPQLDQIFSRHRESISRLVQLANLHASAVESAAETSLNRQWLLMGGVGGLIVLLSLLLNQRLGRQISGSVEHAVAAANRVTAGQLELPIHIPQDSNQEVEQILRSIDNMRQALLDQVHELQRNGERLRQARDQAERASLMKSEFLHTMSHELRTPINGILGMLQIIALDEDNPESRECVDTATSCANRLFEMINDMLLYAGLRSGDSSPYYSPFNLLDSLRSLTFRYQNEAAAKQIALHIETAPELPMALSGEPIYLERALSALVDNAIKFTPTGSVTIRVGPGNIILGEQQRRMFIRFSVADTGPGLPPELQGRNFQAFTQGNGANTRSHGGTGLGLALASALAESMGGWLSGQNRPEGGALFTLELPFSYETDELE